MEDGKDERTAREPLAGALFYMLLGPIVWAVHLTVVYAGHAVLCVKGVMQGALASRIIPFGVALATIVALAALLIAVLAANSRPGRSSVPASAPALFQDKVMMTLALLSAFGVVWAGASALIVEPCLTLR